MQGEIYKDKRGVNMNDLNFDKAIMGAFDDVCLKTYKPFKKCKTVGNVYVASSDGVCTIGIGLDNKYSKKAIYTIKRGQKNYFDVYENGVEWERKNYEIRSTNSFVEILQMCFKNYALSM